MPNDNHPAPDQTSLSCPIGAPHLPGTCAHRIRDGILRDNLPLVAETTAGLAEELRALVGFTAKAPGLQRIFEDLIVWTTCAVCNGGLYERVMDVQFEYLLEQCALLAELAPTMTMGYIIDTATGSGGPIAASHEFMRRLIEDPWNRAVGTRDELLTALSGLAEMAWILVGDLSGPDAYLDRLPA